MSPLPHQLLWEARQLAEAHHLFIVEVHDTIHQQQVTAYVLYRRGINGGRGVRLGKRRDPAALLRLVKTSAGIAKDKAGAPA